MSATVIINRLTGAGPTLTDITETTDRVSTSDVVNPGTSDPLVAPAAGTNYSYWVTTRLECTVAPTTGINNIQWYSDGTSMGTGLTCMGMTATSYVQASGTQGSTGLELNTTNHAGLTAAPVDVTNYTAITTKSVSGSLGATTGQFGDRMVYQIQIASNAVQGTMSTRTFTWSYDET